MNKKIVYSLVAFLMLAANFAGPIQVFADEMGGEIGSGEEIVGEGEENVTGGEVGEEGEENVAGGEVGEEGEGTEEEAGDANVGGMMLMTTPVLTTQNTGCFEYNDQLYGTFGEARNAMGDEGGIVTMVCDAETDKYFGVTKNITLDLNGHAYTTTAVGAFQVKNATLTINDSEGGGSITGENWYAIVNLEGGNVVVNGGDITGARTAIENDKGGVTTQNGGSLTAADWAVTVYKDSEFVMNGGNVTCTAVDGCYAVSGIGNGPGTSGTEGTNAKLTLNAGTITSTELGVYAPQYNGTTMLGNGLTINAAVTGVEVRAGTLVVDGATITVPADAPYEFNPNGNGSTAKGVAIAVAQHTTTQAINATVSSGTFTAPVAFAEANPQNNGAGDVSKVTLAITGGTFNATSGEPVVASEDVEEFITGGTFNKAPNGDYLADGYDAYTTDGETWVAGEAYWAGMPSAVYVNLGETYTFKSLSDEVKAYGGCVWTVGAQECQPVADFSFVGEQVGLFPVFFSDGGVVGYNNRAIMIIVNSEGEIPIYTQIESEIVEEDWIDEELVAKFKTEAGDDVILGYYDVELALYFEDGQLIGYIDETASALKVTLAFPDNLPALADGYMRVYYAIRWHNGMMDIVPVTDNGDGTFSFYTDRFSLYALAYYDVEEPVTVTAPSTGVFTGEEAGSAVASTASASVTTGAWGLVALAAAVVAMVGAVKFAKRR